MTRRPRAHTLTDRRSLELTRTQTVDVTCALLGGAGIYDSVHWG